MSKLREVEEDVELSDVFAKPLLSVVWVAKWICDALFEGALAMFDVTIDGTGVCG